jgi:uncharacterized membrane protein
MSQTRSLLQTPSAAWLVLLAVAAGGCSSEPGPPREVIEIESIEILGDVAEQPPEAAPPVDQAPAEARTARQAADEAKAAADREIDEAGRTVSPPPTSPAPAELPTEPTAPPPSAPEDAASDANS